jgi:hypothetical protein
MITRLLTILACLLALLPAGALRALELQGPLVQGGTVLGRVAPGTPVTLDGRRVRVSGEGVFVIGFDRDSPATHTLVAGPEKRTLAIKPRTYDIQKVTGIAQRIMEPTKADLERIAREQALIDRARATDDARADFAAGFRWPITGRISGVYGSQRRAFAPALWRGRGGSRRRHRARSGAGPRHARRARSLLLGRHRHHRPRPPPVL